MGSLGGIFSDAVVDSSAKAEETKGDADSTPATVDTSTAAQPSARV